MSDADKPPEDATSQIPVNTQGQLARRARDAELEAQRLRDELAIERAKTETQRLEEAKAALDAFRQITDHAVANLSPEYIVDLPAEAYATAAANIAKIIGATQRDGERALIWRERADDIMKWRERRKARDGEGQSRASSSSTPPPPKKPMSIREAFTSFVGNVREEYDEFKKNLR